MLSQLRYSRYLLLGFVVYVLPFAAQAGCNSANGACLDNPLNVGSICGLLQAILTALLTIGTPVAVLFLVYAGFKFVVARGNAEKLGEAKNNLLYVVIGIALFIGAWLLGEIIANTLNQLGVPLVGNCK